MMNCGVLRRNCGELRLMEWAKRGISTGSAIHLGANQMLEKKSFIFKAAAIPQFLPLRGVNYAQFPAKAGIATNSLNTPVGLGA